MIGDYLVVALVFAIAGSFVFIIRHFWLRDAFKEEAPGEGIAAAKLTTNQPASGASTGSQMVGDLL